MKTRFIFLRTLVLAALFTLPVIIFDSCSFCVESSSFFCSLFSETPFAEIKDSTSEVVEYKTDSVYIVHGTACAQSSKNGTEDVLRLEGFRELPPELTGAMIVLNGWDTHYLGGDHHVGGLGVSIRNVRFEIIPEKRTPALRWEANGVLTDDNFDDSYGICYYYTIFAWSNKTMDLFVDQDDGTCTDSAMMTSNFFTADNETATTSLISARTFLFNPEFRGSNEVGIIPRGFAYAWGGCDVDHHILQMAYNMDHSEKYIVNGNYIKASTMFNPSFPDASAKVDSGFVTWESQAIFKDNDGRRDFSFGEIVSGITGSDLSVIDPPYSILPTEDDCDGGVGQTKAEEIVVKDLPYRFVVPMLTGWNIGYLCDDEHVEKAGVWIEKWNYAVDPVTGKGTLTYKLNSDLYDDNQDNSNFRTQKVSILGFKKLLPSMINNEKRADLLPVVPPGTPENSFCRRDPQGNVLYVMVKNQGNSDAPGSVTTVDFAGQKVSMDTPPLKAGESKELTFRFAGNCFNPDCNITIMTDSQKTIDEGNFEMNNSVSFICHRIIL